MRKVFNLISFSILATHQHLKTFLHFFIWGIYKYYHSFTYLLPSQTKWLPDLRIREFMLEQACGSSIMLYLTQGQLGGPNRTLSSLALKTCEDRHCTTPLSNLFQHLTVLIARNDIYLEPHFNFPLLSLMQSPHTKLQKLCLLENLL